MPLPFDSRNENIFQRLGAWAILVTSGHAYRYDIVKSRGPQKSTGSPEVERVRQDVTVILIANRLPVIIEKESFYKNM